MIQIATPPKVDIIVMSDADLIVPMLVGFERQKNAVLHNRRVDVQGQDHFDGHIRGACAEYVVARHLNLWWDPHIGRTGGYDVGRYHVRSTVWPQGHLIIDTDETDRDEDIWILVTHTPDLHQWIIRGWCRSVTARTYDVRRDNGAASGGHYVPQSALRSVNLLPELRAPWEDEW